MSETDKQLKIIVKQYPKSYFLYGKVLENSFITNDVQPNFFTNGVHRLRIYYNVIEPQTNRSIISNVYESLNYGYFHEFSKVYEESLNKVISDFGKIFSPYDTLNTIFFVKRPELDGMDHVIDYIKTNKFDQAQNLLKKMSEVNYKSEKSKIFSLYNYDILPMLYVCFSISSITRLMSISGTKEITFFLNLSSS